MATATTIALPDNTPPPWVYQQPAEIVIAQIDKMTGRANEGLAVAYDSIAKLGNVSIDGEGVAPPDLTLPDVGPSDIARPDKPSAIALGTIDPFDKPVLEEFTNLYAQLDAVVADIPDAGDFEPSIGSIVIPATPDPIDIGRAPDAPVLDALVIPDAPVLNMPTMDATYGLDLPVFVMPEFPTFVDTPISFDGNVPNTAMAYVEKPYTPAVLSDLVREIKLALAGGTGIHPDVEQALFERDRAKNTTTAQQRTAEAFDTWASRGFAMPPGMLVEQVNAAQQESQLASNANARDVLTKSAEWEIENLRNAIAQGIALETQLMGQFNNVLQRAFDMARNRVEADQALFNAQISLFNARQAARAYLVEVFKAKLQGAMSLIDAFKARVEAEQVKAQVNESIVRAYAAKVDALKSIVALFQAKIDAVKTQSEIEKNKVDAFKSSVDAYSAQLGAEKVRFDAYEAQVRGESAKAGIIEAEARAFAATVEAQVSGSNIKIAAINGKISAIGAAVQRFTAQTGAERDRIGAQASAIQAKAQAFSADASRYTAEIGANTEETRLAITQTESRLRNSIAYYDTRIREYDAAQNRLIERARVIIGALTASGQMAAQLAAGAMSATHVQASLSGSGSASTGWSSSSSYSESHNYEDESTSHE